ncbi:hypothetical protein B566_EDAN011281, partial [Ephemera danica]
MKQKSSFSRMKCLIVNVYGHITLKTPVLVRSPNIANVYGHITLKAPVLVRSLKLSNVERDYVIHKDEKGFFPLDDDITGYKSLKNLVFCRLLQRTVRFLAICRVCRTRGVAIGCDWGDWFFLFFEMFHLGGGCVCRFGQLVAQCDVMSCGRDLEHFVMHENVTTTNLMDEMSSDILLITNIRYKDYKSERISVNNTHPMAIVNESNSQEIDRTYLPLGVEDTNKRGNPQCSSLYTQVVAEGRFKHLYTGDAEQKLIARVRHECDHRQCLRSYHVESTSSRQITEALSVFHLSTDQFTIKLDHDDLTCEAGLRGFFKNLLAVSGITLLGGILFFLAIRPLRAMNQ